MPGNTNPVVLSILKSAPTTELTAAESVAYAVTFNQSVTGVNAADFHIFTDGALETNAAVTVAGSGAAYTVTVGGIHGNGDLRLDLVDDDSIAGSGQKLGGTGVNNGSFSGAIYKVLQTGPTVTSIAATDAAHTKWTVTFSEAVTGVNAADFTLAKMGVTTDAAVTVTPTANAAVYTVAVTGVSGSGLLRVDLVDDGTIKDLSGNLLRTTPLNFADKVDATTGSRPTDVAVADINGDGKPDMVVVNNIGKTIGVLLGNGDGTFQTQTTFTTTETPYAVTLADVNGDGKPDLLYTKAGIPGTVQTDFIDGPNRVAVLLGNGNGTFQAETTYALSGNPLAIAVGDVNRDGRPDIAVTAGGVNQVDVLFGNGNGTFQTKQSYATGSAPSDVALADMNGDGKPDIVVVNSGGTPSAGVLLNNGSGTFATMTSTPTGSGMTAGSTALAVGDVNGDGKLDVVVGNVNDKTVSILLGDNTGSLGAQTTQATTVSPRDVKLIDFNGDGKLDIAVGGSLFSAGFGGEVAAADQQQTAFVEVLGGSGTGTFATSQTFATGSSPNHLAIADLNGDGKPDAVSTNDQSNTASALLNIGNGAFTGENIEVSTPTSALTITSITDGKTTAATKDLLTYAIVYANGGAANSQIAALTVPLPEGTHFIAKENAGWTLNAGILTKSVGAVKKNATGKATLKLHVDDTVAEELSNITTTVRIAEVSMGKRIAAREGNSATDTDTLAALADLTITAIADPYFAVEGRSLTYTISYQNIGTRDVNGADFTITLPDNSDYNSANDALGWQDNNDGTASLFIEDTIDAGAAASTVNFTVDVNYFKGIPDPFTVTAHIQPRSELTEVSTTNNTKSESTPIYTGFLVTSPGVAVAKRYAPPKIRVLDRATGVELYSFLAYESNYRDSIRVAVGDFNGDGIDDIVTTTQRGTGRLRIFDGFDGTRFGSQISVLGDQETPFQSEVAVFDGHADKGAFVAVGDVTGDGQVDIVTGSALGGAKVKIYNGRTGAVVTEYTPFGADFKGGVRVAVGHIHNSFIVQPQGGEIAQGPGSNVDDVIVGQGYFGGQVKVYTGATQNVFASFSVGGEGYKGGVSVAAGDVNRDGLDEIFVGRNSGKPSQVEVFRVNNQKAALGEIAQGGGISVTALGTPIIPFDSDPLHPRYIYGVRVGAVDVNLDGIADIIAAVGVQKGSRIRIYDGATHEEIVDRSFNAYPTYPNVALWVAGSKDSNNIG